MTIARAYYNEIDPFSAAWLRNLISEGLIADGDVDERSIVDVRPSDLTGYSQCHFFAGIGGWPYALRLSGWPDDRPVWTGSCPCQPFSAAGKGGGFADERHLWPSWFHLIGVCRPPVLFGEQVASGPAGLWCDLVQDDLEALGYAFGAVPLPAASVGAPHLRDRLWWVADALPAGRPEWWPGTGHRPATRSGGASELANAPGEHITRTMQEQGGKPGFGGEGMQAGGRGGPLVTGNPGSTGLALGSLTEVECRDVRDQGAAPREAESVCDHWSRAEWLPCRDGKFRPVEPGVFPLAHGVPNRVGTLRGAGNAIVPKLAAEFIRAYSEIRGHA